MEDALRLLINDLVQFGLNIKLTEMAMPLGIALWLVIVFLPTRGFDKRDIFCGLTYIIFHTAVGIALILAIPQKYIQMPTAATQVMMVLAMVALISMRWFLRRTSLRSLKEQLDRMGHSAGGKGNG